MDWYTVMLRRKHAWELVRISSSISTYPPFLRSTEMVRTRRELVSSSVALKQV